MAGIARVCGKSNGGIVLDVATLLRPIAKYFEGDKEVVVLPWGGEPLHATLNLGVGQVRELALEAKAIEKAFVVGNSAGATGFSFFFQKQFELMWQAGTLWSPNIAGSAKP